jgi:acetyl esterase
MPLDPQARAFLDQLAALGGIQLHELPVAQAREAMEAMSAMRAGEPESCADIGDRTIPGPAGEIPVRVYRPVRDGIRPALVYFHGGGWVLGSLETHDAVCRTLANAADCVVVSVDYRLAPEHGFPAAPEDCWAATRWVADHGASIGADGRRLAIGGDSAGGNLTAVVALMARERGGPPIRFQLLVYPVTDFSFDTPSYRDNAEGYLLTTDGMRWFWNHYLAKPATGREPFASPLRAESLKGLPPALVITAEFDPLRDEGEAYARRLREAGVPTTLSRYDGQLHGFFSMGDMIDAGKKALREAAAALRAAL